MPRTKPRTMAVIMFANATATGPKLTRSSARAWITGMKASAVLPAAISSPAKVGARSTKASDRTPP